MDPEAIRDLLIEIKTRLDLLVGQHSDHEARLRVIEAAPDTSQTLTDHEVRLRGLERRAWVALGAAAAAGGLAGKVVGLF